MSTACPLYPRKRTLELSREMSALSVHAATVASWQADCAERSGITKLIASISVPRTVLGLRLASRDIMKTSLLQFRNCCHYRGGKDDIIDQMIGKLSGHFLVRDVIRIGIPRDKARGQPWQPRKTIPRSCNAGIV